MASTNQAASAESLQHQTPSLENLLARSRIFDERIPEVVADDASLQETPLGLLLPSDNFCSLSMSIAPVMLDSHA